MQAPEKITNVKTLAERLKWAREFRKLSQKQLAAASGVEQGTISNVETGLRKQPRELLEMARALGANPDWLKKGTGEPFPPDGGFPLDHAVSQETVKIPQRSHSATVIGWGAMKKEDLPGVFLVTMPDDSMADRVCKGHLIELARDGEPVQGDGVLVAASDGRWYFRIYSEGPDGTFEAQAIHRNFRTLDSVHDGLTVLGVMTSLPNRWGQA